MRQAQLRLDVHGRKLVGEVLEDIGYSDRVHVLSALAAPAVRRTLLGVGHWCASRPSSCGQAHSGEEGGAFCADERLGLVGAVKQSLLRGGMTKLSTTTAFASPRHHALYHQSLPSKKQRSRILHRSPSSAHFPVPAPPAPTSLQMRTLTWCNPTHLPSHSVAPPPPFHPLPSDANLW